MTIRWIKCFCAGMIFLGVSATELAGLPRFALTSGATCSSCHVNVTGGAMRTEGGWFSIRNVGLIQPRNTFLAPLYGAKSNALFAKNLRWGFDMRVQVAKRGRELKRDVFAMQAVPYLSFEVRENLYLYGSFNFVEPLFPSQQRFTAAVFYRPLEKVAFKAGFIQPKFGIRYDDHTVFTRQQAQLRPMYQELGMELYVSPRDWLTITGGVYSPEHRAAESNVPINESSVMIGGGVDFRPMDWEKGLSYLLSGSFLLQDGQTMYGVQAGIGLIDEASFIVDYVRWENDVEGLSPLSRSDILSVSVSYQLLESLVLEMRAEQATGKGRSERRERQLVLGFQVFVLPFVELRPEYRWRDTPEVQMAQYTAQLHIFY